MKFKTYINIIVLLLILLISNSLYVIKESEQVIVTQFGKPIGGRNICFRFTLEITINSDCK